MFLAKAACRHFTFKNRGQNIVLNGFREVLYAKEEFAGVKSNKTIFLDIYFPKAKFVCYYSVSLTFWYAPESFTFFGHFSLSFAESFTYANQSKVEGMNILSVYQLHKQDDFCFC